MKTRRVLLAALLVAALGGLAWQAWRPPAEPVYQGKTLDDWLDDVFDGFPTARQALHQIGPTAIPGIIRRLEQNDSPLRNAYRDRWPTLPSALKKLLPAPKRPTFSTRSAYKALFYIGPEVTRPLIPALKGHNPAVREVSIEAMVICGAPLSTNEALPLFIELLKDDDAFVRLHAAIALGRIGPAASNAVPALIAALGSSEAGRLKGSRVLVHDFAAEALGKIGPGAKSAIPLLTNALVTGDIDLRVMAACAIWHISSNDVVVVPVLVADGPKADLGNHRSLAFETLGEIGPRAKAAVPMLLNELNHSTAWNLADITDITNALKAIDPEAAAKAGRRVGELGPPWHQNAVENSFE